jgi:DNA polymerase
MKRSKFGKLVKLAKNCLNEEALWGEAEAIIVNKPAAPVKSTGLKPASAPNSIPKERLSYAVSQAALKFDTLESLKQHTQNCKKCGLAKSRLNVVFGVGDPKAKLLFIGEGPGFDEDHKGEPFVGRAGQLLNKIIESIGLTREQVYIANIVKCHPVIDPTDVEKHGNDRPPTPEEVTSCKPYLDCQIDIIKPKVICLLGNSSAQTILATEIGISKLRGVFCEYKGIKVMPTYHPAALLRNPSLKKEVWEDMKMIREALK